MIPRSLYIKYFIVVLKCIILLKVCLCEDTHTDLRTRLLEHYDPKVPPPTGSNEPVNVQIGLVLTHFSLDESIQEFQANVWFTFAWNDERLRWNKTSVTDIINMKFSTQEIWLPDVTLINNANPTETLHYGESLLMVKADGEVLWTPPSKLIAHCSMDMIRWPYDEHNCKLKIGSWTYHGKEMDLEIGSRVETDPNHAIDQNLFIPNSEWNLLSSESQKETEFYACCENPYAVITYNFRIKRNSPSYAATVILPIIVITLVNIMVFILPPTAGEKISLASINFLIVCLFLIYFEVRLPSFGDHLPLLVLLYSCNVVMIGISLIISVIVINLSRNRKASSPPQCFRMFCNANFAQFLGLGYIVPYVSQTHLRLNDGVEMRTARENGRVSFDAGDKDDQTQLVVDNSDQPYLLNAEWILLAAMIDRLTLIMYTIVSGILLGLCLA